MAGEPRAAELDSAGDPLVVHVGAVARGRGQLGDADVVAVVAGRGARGRVFENPGAALRSRASWPAGRGSSVSPCR